MLQVADTSEGPRVRVRLEVAEPRHQTKPVLKKTTREHEVYEVSGFLFKKKRKNPQSAATEQPAECMQPEDETQTVRDTKDELPEQSPTAVREEAEAAAQDTITGSGFIDVCREACSTALRLQDGTVQSDSVTTSIDSALKEWLAEMEGGVATSGPVEELQAAKRSLAASSENEINKSILRTIISKLEKEEADWQGLEAQLAEQQPLASNGLWKEMEDAYVSDTETEQVKQSLEAARRATHQQLSLQVEAYSGLVTGVETLLRKAEQTCSIMQADYHKEKFRAFPHVNSPASLIKGLARFAK